MSDSLYSDLVHLQQGINEQRGISNSLRDVPLRGGENALEVLASGIGNPSEAALDGIFAAVSGLITLTTGVTATGDAGEGDNTNSLVSVAGPVIMMAAPEVPSTGLRVLLPENESGVRPPGGGGGGGEPGGNMPPPSQYIYRAGGTNPGSLRMRPHETAVSFRQSLSNPMPGDGVPVFELGDAWFEVDTARLPDGSVVYDDTPFHHVSVNATAEQIRAALTGVRGKFPK